MPAHIVGYSMGSAITLKLVSEHPERVASAVLGGFGWRAPDDGPPEGVIQLRAQLERAALGEMTLAEILTTSEGLDLPPAMRDALNSNDLVALKAVHMSDRELRTVTEAALRTNTTPILAVVGERDWARPDAEAMVDIAPNSQIEIIPNASHVTAVSHPLFLDTIVRFLQMR